MKLTFDEWVRGAKNARTGQPPYSDLAHYTAIPQDFRALESIHYLSGYEFRSASEHVRLVLESVANSPIQSGRELLRRYQSHVQTIDSHGGN